MNHKYFVNKVIPSLSIVLIIKFLLLFTCVDSFAADTSSAFQGGKTPEVSSDLQSSSISNLAVIKRNIDWLQGEIDRKKKEQRIATKDDAAAMQEEISNFEDRLQKARLSFIAIASDVDIPPPEEKDKPQKRDLLQEAVQLIEPLFDVVRRVSEKPRRIQSFRSQIEYFQDRLGLIERAIIGLEKAIHQKKFPTYEKQLLLSRESLSHDRDELQVQISGLERKLTLELEDRRTVIQVIKEGVKEFFTTQGKNILISLLVFYSVLWLMGLLKRSIFNMPWFSVKLQASGKLIQLAYGVGTVLAAIGAVLITLHFLNDWFLVTVITLVLITLGWLLKSFIHLFSYEAKLALNLGPVKQGERVVWQGLPWLVKELNFRSILVNEALQGATVTLPASIIMTLFSRAAAEGESWFPSKLGDYVLLEDGNYGKVESQTMETVVIKMGQVRKYYPTQVFLARGPQNFSAGFEVSSEIILKYPKDIQLIHPTESTEQIRSLFIKSVTSRLKPFLEHENPSFRNLEVSLVNAGIGISRALLKADCDGCHAPERDTLRRALYAAAGEAWREALVSLH